MFGGMSREAGRWAGGQMGTWQEWSGMSSYG